MAERGGGEGSAGAACLREPPVREKIPSISFNSEPPALGRGGSGARGFARVTSARGSEVGRATRLRPLPAPIMWLRILLPDRAAWWLLGSNVATLAVAIWQRWPILLLLWPYWAQSVIIGLFARRRIALAPGYRIGAMRLRINRRVVGPAEYPPPRLARFFSIHYGGFHAFYLLFLLAPTLRQLGGDLRSADALWVGAPVLGFAIAHARSHFDDVAADAAQLPTAGELMGWPYLRVVPMHLTIIFGMALGTPWALALFVLLKTAVDLLLHLYEHWILRHKTPASQAAARQQG
jgi:hypothetical protein